jgi:hypothetical protein
VQRSIHLTLLHKQYTLCHSTTMLNCSTGIACASLIRQLYVMYACAHYVIQNLELLKLRLGATSLQQCEVMVKDVEDAKVTSST